jgi:hypothetical protein
MHNILYHNLSLNPPPVILMILTLSQLGTLLCHDKLSLSAEP